MHVAAREWQIGPSKALVVAQQQHLQQQNQLFQRKERGFGKTCWYGQFYDGYAPQYNLPSTALPSEVGQIRAIKPPQKCYNYGDMKHIAGNYPKCYNHSMNFVYKAIVTSDWDICWLNMFS